MSSESTPVSTPVPEPAVILAAALGYLARGWAVVPVCLPDPAGGCRQHGAGCESPGKRPLVPWADLQHRLPTADEVTGWCGDSVPVNVGVVLGTVSRLVGIDVDDPAGQELLDRLGAPPTLAFSTSRGQRLLFRLDEGVACPSGRFVEGDARFEVLGDGRMTLMPPSTHQSGSVYTFTAEVEPAAPPEWLVEFLANPAGRQPSEPAGESAGGVSVVPRRRPGGRNGWFEHPTPIVEGERNTTLTSLAGLMRRDGMSESELREELQRINAEYCVPPLSDADVRAIARSVSRYPAGETRPPRSRGHGLPKARRQGRRIRTRRISDAATEAVRWLWTNWVPLGKITVLDGDPGLGKSTVLFDLAARVSRGAAMPDGSPGVAGNVLIMSLEDSVSDTIKPRLDAAGADTANLTYLDEVEDAEGGRPLAIPDDLDLIEDAIRQHQARLLVIDPLVGYLSGVDAAKDQDVRRVLGQLKNIAERTGCAILLVRHLNKSSGGHAIYRGGGSIGIIGAARLGLLIARDPNDPESRVLACNKTNLGPPPTSRSFRLEPVAGTGVCRIVWGDTVEITAEELLGDVETQAAIERKIERKRERQSKQADAVAFLRDFLANGPKPVDICHQEFKSSGLNGSQRTLERARANVAELLPPSHPDNTTNGYAWRLLPESAVVPAPGTDGGAADGT